jgi:drug/metabolite transporter (DMT)-like permease
MVVSYPSRRSGWAPDAAWYRTRVTAVTRRRAYLAWVTVCIVWGTTYLAIRIALESIPPMLMAATRWIVAGSILIVALRVRGATLPGPRAWPALTILGVLLLGFGNGAVVWAELTVPSGLTAVLVATVPFWMVGIERLTHGGERVGPRSLVGLAIGFAGIVLLVWPEITWGRGGRGFLIGLASTQLACLGWALGSSYARWRGRSDAPDENVLASAAFEMLFGGLVLLVVGLALGEWSRLAFTTRTSLALAHLILFGAIAGFTAYGYALKHLPVSTVSLYAYVNPVIALVLGTLLLHEPFGVRTIVAAGVVFLGIALVRSEVGS